MKYILRQCGWSLCSLGLLIALLAYSVITASADQPAPTTQETPPPDYSAYTQSYHMPFGNAKPVDFDHLQSMDVRASINGGPVLRFQVDTGSTGVIVGATDVPNVDPNAPPGQITYISSGVELDGVWTPATITFPDSKDEHGNVATAIVPVLAVNQRVIHPGAVNGSKKGATTQITKNPKPYMFGIGTGRGNEVHQERNPWVNLKEMQAGTMRRGYTITRDGITLGLTAKAVGQSYLFEKLNEHLGTPTTVPVTPAPPKDWDSSQGWVTVDGKKTGQMGMLLDTGLTNFMIELPEVIATRDEPAGTDITVNLLSGKLSYNFKVGDTKNPAAPRRVTWVHYPIGPHVNTGLRALALYDYLYDADGGYLGLRPVEKKSK